MTALGRAVLTALAAAAASAGCTSILDDGQYSIEDVSPNDAGPGGARGSDATRGAENGDARADVADACSPGTRRCQNDDVLECSVSSQWVETQACPYLCTGAGVCSGACTPGAAQCAGDGVQVCDATGAWQPSTPCSFGCDDGVCSGSCVAGTTQCSGAVAQICDSTGTWQTSQTCPFVCSAGSCTGTCLPGATQCSGSTPQTCDASGTWQDDTACAQPTPDCLGGSCTCLQTACSGTCTDTQTDPANCGACGQDCQGQPCANGLCEPVTLASGQDTPWAIALGGAEGYWTDEGAGTVMAVNLSAGGAPSQLAVVEGGSPTSIATDSTNVYWVDSASGAVYECALGGCPSPTELAPEASPWGIAVAAADAYVTAGASVVAIPLGDGGAAAIATDSNTPYAIAVDGTDAYFTDSQGAVLACAIPQGCSIPTTLVAATGSPSYGIAVDAANVYFTSSAGSVWKVSKSGAGATVLASGGSAPFGIAVDATYVYWTDGGNGTVMKALIDPAEAGPTSITLASGLGKPNGIAVDATYVYWTDTEQGTVMKTPK